jgi:hypothetical protein
MEPLYDPDQLPDIGEIRSTWTGPGVESTGLWTYLDFKGSMQLAYGFSSLFWPDFVEVDGALILAEKYAEERFQNWYQHFQGDLTAIEKMMNHVHIEDLFMIGAHDDDLDNRVWDTVVSVLESCWRAATAARFLNESVVVETWGPEDGSAAQLTICRQR